MTDIPNQSLNLAALILAGGQSSRMGEDKALVTYKGIPMLQHVHQVAAACTANVYVLSPWNERYQPILPSQCKYFSESQIGRGPLFGFAEGLTQISADWVLLLACDLPLLNIKILQNWANQLPQIPLSTDALVPRRSQIWEPMCGFYRRQILTELEDFLQTGGRSFQKWLSHICVQSLPISPQTNMMLHNCNTPLDLEEITK